MPGPEEDAAADVLAGLRDLATSNRLLLSEIRMLRDELAEMRKQTRVEPITERPLPEMGPQPGTVPAAQILTGAASLIRALNSGGRVKKKKRSDG